VYGGVSLDLRIPTPLPNMQGGSVWNYKLGLAQSGTLILKPNDLNLDRKSLLNTFSIDFMISRVTKKFIGNSSEGRGMHAILSMIS